jgi:hypothetical protein
MLQSTAKLVPKIALMRLALPTPDYEPIEQSQKLMVRMG